MVLWERCMNKSIFFFDIDNTLLFNEVIPVSAINSLIKLRELGHYVYICTGRPEFLVKPILKQIEVDGYIVSNGRACYINNKLEYDLTIDNDIVNEIIKEVLNNKESYSYLSDKGLFTYDQSCNIFKNYLGKFPMIPECKDNQLTCDIKSFVIHPKDINYYKNKFNNEQFLAVNEYGYEYLAKTFSKGTACKYLIDKLKVKESYGFGDEINDLSMFENVSVSIAMGNAVEELKSVASHVTKNVDEDGIEYALKNILKVI